MTARTTTMHTQGGNLNLSALKVSESFGPTFEGEGPTTGQLTWFLRTAECNQHCGFCDTPYTWAFTDRKAEQHRSGHRWDRDEQMKLYTLGEARQELLDLGLAEHSWLSLSGGEPMPQQEGLTQLLSVLRSDLLGLKVKVETAGTIPILPTFANLVDAFVVSPKLEHSGNEKALRYKPEVLRTHRALGNADFKFVVQSEADFAEIREIQDEIGIPNRRVWIMPEGVDLETITRRLQELHLVILKHKYNGCGRFHIQVFGDKRGT